MLIKLVIWKQLLIFFFPIMLGTFFQQLYNTVDAIIVGNYVNTAALAAVGGSTSTIINLIIGFFVGLSGGATVIISQYYGGYQIENVKKAVHTAFAIAILAGLFLMVFGYFVAPIALVLMNTHADILPYATQYLQIYFMGTVFNMIYNIGSGILRSVGDSRRPLYFLICACLVNIVLDIVFVVFLHMEVIGVALATILSQLVSAILVVYTLVNNDQIYHLTKKELRIDFPILKRIVYIGLPAGIQSIMYSFSNVVIQTSVNAFDTNYVAAWPAYSKLDAIFWMVLGAFGLSITTFAGQNFGAGKIDRVKQGVRVSLLMSAIMSVSISILFYLLGPFFFRLFTSDTQVITNGLEILHFLSPFFVTFIFIEILSGALRGTGDTLFPTIITALGVVGIRIAWLALIQSTQPSITVVFVCYPLSWIITSLIFIIYYKEGSWLKRRLKTLTC